MPRIANQITQDHVREAFHSGREAALKLATKMCERLSREFASECAKFAQLPDRSIDFVAWNARSQCAREIAAALAKQAAELT